MKWIKNERGITLVEVLATMTIFMLFITLFYQVLIQVVERIDYQQTKEEARQKANYLMALLTDVHQTSITYTVSIDESGIIQIQNGLETYEVDTSPYTVDLFISQQEQPLMINTTLPENKIVDLEVTFTNTEEKRTDSFTFQSKISRLTEAKEE